jgi:hypothetical protein
MKATALTANVTGYRVAGLHGVAKAAGLANHAARTVVLFGAAPFIGLAFVIALPFAGLGFAAYLAAHALVTNRKAIWARTRNVVLFLAAPFIGLAYAVALPFVGVGALAWMALGAATKRTAAA